MSYASSSARPRRPLLAAMVGMLIGGALVAAGAWAFYTKPWQSNPSSNVPPGQTADAGGGPCRACDMKPPSRFGEADGDGPPGMVWVPGGEFTMGNSGGSVAIEAEQPWEKPAHRVKVDGYYIDRFEVTNAQFQAFVEATNYVTTAEKVPDVNQIMKGLPAGSPPPPQENLVPGSLVFQRTYGPVETGGHSWYQWWKYVAGAQWRHPEGPGSDIKDKAYHPVVQVSWEDAVAYCKWAGKRLPTEAEWEFAARGGLQAKPYAWGDAPYDPKQPQANIWTGEFPWKNTAADGFELTAPVGKFPANGYGLHDMGGNVWEWCSDWFSPETYQRDAVRGVVANPQGPEKSVDPDPGMDVPKKAIRGGSFLCSDTYCSSYRPSARMHTDPFSSANHQGFRCVMTKAMWEEVKAKRAAMKSATAPATQPAK